MILGLSAPNSYMRHPAANCFVEIDEAVRQLRGKDDVWFNCHIANTIHGSLSERIPQDAIAYNTETLGVQWDVDDAKRVVWKRRVWDISLDNVVTWRRAGVQAEWVPIGYHPSMKRFERAKEPDLDVVFAGCMNDRRARVFEAIEAAGRKVTIIPFGTYGAERDAYYARAKLCVVPRFYENGVFPAVRVAHLVANAVPVLVEEQPDAWPSLDSEPIGGLALAALELLRAGAALWHAANNDAERFAMSPMVLPS